MIEYLMLILGLFLLVKGADFLIDASSSLAHKLGVSSLFIGLSVLAFGTSLPELIVNIIAVINGSGEIALGNIIGSNMSNILLVLGSVSLITTIKVYDSTIKKEIPFSIFSILLIFIFSGVYFLLGKQIAYLSIFEGTILIIAFSLFVYYLILMLKSDRSNVLNFKKETMSNYKITFMIFFGLFFLYLGGKWTVDYAIIVANNFGVSQFFISATIIALGTSLPELVTCIVAALKKEVDLLVGNIIGSNIFNLLWVLGVTSFIMPISIPYKYLIDLFILLLVSLLLLFLVSKNKQIGRNNGILFLLLYLMYIISLIYRG